MSHRLLIVGSDGLIGKALFTYWQGRQLPVTGTSRRPTLGSTVHFDLAEPAGSWPELSGFAAAVLCGAVTNGDHCRRYAEASRHVNVHQTVRLAERLARKGAFVVFISSNAVFDGTKPMRNPDEPLCPMTEYGRQKAAAESMLTALGDQAAILRLTKVIHPNMPLLRGWVGDLKRGRVIAPFSDYVCAPIELNAVIPALATLAEKRLAGKWQLSARSDVTYEAIARELAAMNSVADGLIRPVRTGNCARLEHVPQHTTLNAIQSASALGFHIPAPLAAVRRMIVS